MTAEVRYRYWSDAIGAYVRNKGRTPVFLDDGSCTLEGHEGETLLDFAQRYFDSVADHPMLEQKAFSYQGDVNKTYVERQLPFTLERFCVQSGFHPNRFRVWEKREGTALSEMCKLIRAIIEADQTEGAMSNAYNGHFVGRILGLVDKRELTSPDGSMSPKPALDVSKLSVSTMKELLAARRMDEETVKESADDADESEPG